MSDERLHTEAGVLLRLPELPPQENVGARLVLRAVQWTLLILALAMAGVVIVASVVEIDVTIDAAGVLEPEVVWPVRSRETGVVTAVLVAPGDSVKQGQVLARLDSIQLKRVLGQLQSDLATRRLALERTRFLAALELQMQQSVLRQAEAQRIRSRAAFRERMVEHGYRGNLDSLQHAYRAGQHVGMDRAYADVVSAEADLRHQAVREEVLKLSRYDLDQEQIALARLRAELETVQERMRRLTLVAPATGIVLTEQLHERLLGTYVQEGQHLLDIAEGTAWKVTLLVRQRDVHRIKQGHRAKVEIQALRTSETYDLLPGRVVSVAYEPEGSAAQNRSAATGLYPVTVMLEPAAIETLGHDKLRRGYTVEGKIITQSGPIIALLWQYLRERLDVRL